MLCGAGSRAGRGSSRAAIDASTQYQRDTGLNWPSFDLIPPHDVLPGSASALEDWALFETRLEPMARAAHRFSILLPTSGPLTEVDALAQEIQLAERVVRLEKPAHTVFDVRQ